MLSKSLNVCFLSKALAVSKGTLRSPVGARHRRLGPRPVLARLCIGFVHCPSMSRPQVPWGSPRCSLPVPPPAARLQGFRFGSAGAGGAPQRMAGLRPQLRWELWRHKARGRGGCCPDGWAGCPLPVHAGALRRAPRGRAGPARQATAVEQQGRASSLGRELEGPLGQRGEQDAGPTARSRGAPNSEERVG